MRIEKAFFRNAQTLDELAGRLVGGKATLTLDELLVGALELNLDLRLEDLRWVGAVGGGGGQNSLSTVALRCSRGYLDCCHKVQQDKRGTSKKEWLKLVEASNLEWNMSDQNEIQ